MNGTCSDCKYFDMFKCLKWGGMTYLNSPSCDAKIVRVKEKKKPEICPRCKSVMNEIWDELGGHDCPNCNNIVGRLHY